MPDASSSSVRTPTGLATAVFLGSFAAVYLQIAFLKLTALTFDPMLVFAMIGVALLGYGVAGSILAARGGALPSPAAIAYGFTALSATAVPVFLIVNAIDVPAGQVFGTLAGLPMLLGLYTLLATPFFLAGIAMSVAFATHPDDANRLYFADLVGAGCGSMLAAASLPWVGGLGLLAVAGTLAAVAGLIAARQVGRAPTWPAIAIALNLAALGYFTLGQPVAVRIAPDKHGPVLARSANPKGLRADFSQWSRFGRVDITEPFTSLQPQWGGDLSPRFGDIRISQRMLTLDGAAPAFLYQLDRPLAELEFLGGTSQTPAHLLRPGARVMVIGIGGGTDILIAMRAGARSIRAVELSEVNVHAVRSVFGDYVGHILDDPRVEVRVAEGRNFVARDPDRYDVIQLSGVDTGAALGAYGLGTMPESYLYTVEALGDLLDHLAPQGILTMTRDTRFAWALRLTAVTRAALAARGLDAGPRIAVIGGKTYGWATMLAKREPFTDDELARLRAFTTEYGFDLLYAPDGATTDAYADVIRTGATTQNLADLRPSTDDWPFFFLSFPPSAVLSVLRQDRNPLVNPIVFLIVNLVGLGIAAFAGIVVPLWWLRRAWHAVPAKLSVAAYFALLGAGFMLVEVALVQRFTIYLGNPVLAVATVIGTLLVGSGLGSALARRWNGGLGMASAAAVLVVVAQGFYVSPWSHDLLRATLGTALPVRLLLTGLVIGITAIPMGIPFPAGLSRVARYDRAMVPWGWGINGMLSVVSSLASYFIGMTAGYTAMYVLAGGLYLGVALLGRRL